MDTWESLYPNRIYHFNYEKFLQDQTTATRGLINYLDLTWKDSFMFPETNSRTVTTASQQQVRKPVYQGSNDQWKLYEKYLGHEFEKLQST